MSMRSRRFLAVALAALLVPSWAVADAGKKAAAVASIDTHAPELIHLSEQIWAFAETALREHKSAKVLADYAEARGFKVRRGKVGGYTDYLTPEDIAFGKKLEDRLRQLDDER